MVHHESSCTQKWLVESVPGNNQKKRIIRQLKGKNAYCSEVVDFLLVAVE